MFVYSEPLDLDSFLGLPTALRLLATLGLVLAEAFMLAALALAFSVLVMSVLTMTFVVSILAVTLLYARIERLGGGRS